MMKAFNPNYTFPDETIQLPMLYLCYNLYAFVLVGALHIHTASC